MNFSRLEKIQLINFFAYSNEVLEVGDSNIVNIKGLNGSGKSTIINALNVLFFNENTTKQKHFIKAGEDFFKIIVTFDDGVSIEYEKLEKGPSAYTMRKNNEVIFSTIQNGVYTTFKEVPYEISKYLSLNGGEGQALHYKKIRDKLLLVDTTGRENHELLSDVLRADDIADALDLARKDINKNNRKLDKLSVKEELIIEEIENQGIFKYDFIDDVLDELEKDLQKIDKTKSSLNILTQIETDIESIEHIEKTPHCFIQELDSYKFNSLLNLEKEINAYMSVDNSFSEYIDTFIDNRTVEGFNSLLNLEEEINNYLVLENDIVNGVNYFIDDTFDLNLLNSLNNLENSINDLKLFIDDMMLLYNAIIEDNKTLTDLMLDLKSQGYNVFNCSSCSTLNLVDSNGNQTHSH